jgi:hypothetical protein
MSQLRVTDDEMGGRLRFTIDRMFRLYVPWLQYVQKAIS